MKRALPIIAIALASMAAVWLSIAIGVSVAWKRAGRTPWPMGLGTLEDLPKRFPKREAGVAALRLAELARPLAGEGDPLRPFFYVEHERNDVTVGEVPPETAEFLAAHEARIDAVRAHVLRGGDFGWAVDLDQRFDAPVPDLPLYMKVVQTLVARALIRSDWEDLHAAFLVASSLETRPELVSQLMVVASHRTVNAAAWKMPLPAPAWVAELRRTDHHRLFLRGMQTEAWILWKQADTMRMPLARQYALASAANLALHQRRTARELENVTSCGFDATRYFEERVRNVREWNIAGQMTLANYGSAWSRVRKLDVEREATANALRVRTGQPIDPRSRCSDGTWRFANGTLSFSGELPRVTDTEMPLTLVISPR